MSSLQLRPTFSIALSSDFSGAWNRLKSEVASLEDELCGQFRGQQAMIAIVEAKRHFWSPWLHLELRKSESGNSIYGRFSPHPSIWTGFAFSYFALSIITTFGIIFGCSQLLIDATPIGFLIAPICVLIALVLWIVAHVGQRLATDEMTFMRQVVQNSLDDSNGT